MGCYEQWEMELSWLWEKIDYAEMVTVINVFLPDENKVQAGSIYDAYEDQCMADDAIEGDFLLGQIVNGQIRDMVIVKTSR